MAEYTNNSFKAKEEKKERTEKQAVVSKTPKTRKKSEIQKAAGLFISEDASTVKEHLIQDVVIPTAKDLIVNVITDAVNIIFWGSTRRKSGSGSRIGYASRFDEVRDPRDRDRDRRRDRTAIEYDDIIFDNRGDAEAVLANMDACLEQYGVVTVLDLFDFAGVTTHNYMADRYGWKNLSNAEVRRIRDGFIIDLPRAFPIDR